MVRQAHHERLNLMAVVLGLGFGIPAETTALRAKLRIAGYPDRCPMQGFILNPIRSRQAIPKTSTRPMTGKVASRDQLLQMQFDCVAVCVG